MVELGVTVVPDGGLAALVSAHTPGMAVLVTVQMAMSPSASVRTPAVTDAPLQTHSPTATAAAVTLGSPTAPLIGVVPAADNVQSVGTAVPPVPALSTSLTKVSLGETGMLVIRQITLPPVGTCTRPASLTTAPSQTQFPEVKPSGPLSARS